MKNLTQNKNTRLVFGIVIGIALGFGFGALNAQAELKPHGTLLIDSITQMDILKAEGNFRNVEEVMLTEYRVVGTNEEGFQITLNGNNKSIRLVKPTRTTGGCGSTLITSYVESTEGLGIQIKVIIQDHRTRTCRDLKTQQLEVKVAIHSELLGIDGVMVLGGNPQVIYHTMGSEI